MKTIFYGMLLSMFISNSMYAVLRPHPERSARRTLVWALVNTGRPLMRAGNHFDSVGYVTTLIALIVRDENR